MPLGNKLKRGWCSSLDGFLPFLLLQWRLPCKCPRFAARYICRAALYTMYFVRSQNREGVAPIDTTISRPNLLPQQCRFTHVTITFRHSMYRTKMRAASLDSCRGSSWAILKFIAENQKEATTGVIEARFVSNVAVLSTINSVRGLRPNKSRAAPSFTSRGWSLHRLKPWWVTLFTCTLANYPRSPTDVVPPD